MEHIITDFSKITGRIKPMHAVNNGPVRPGHDGRRNFETYAAAGFPYARTHDAACSEEYGGHHVVDICGIFPDFSKDPYDPASYDFAMTDNYFKNIVEAGTEVFNRLGAHIEHGVKKYGTLPPPDFKKWAVICEHIIRHYTERWADGFNYKIEYWEIWNEADLSDTDSGSKPTWGGTREEFFELYRITAAHLKEKFPHLKIGGPALAGNLAWAEDFLAKLDAPLDFFSWHIYASEPCEIVKRAEYVSSILEKYGHGDAESILNEWNYVSDWGEGFPDSIKTLISMKGAAFDAACMCEGQRVGIDMMMYYDVRPCVWCGLFDYHTLRPIWGYYVFRMFADLYEMGNAVECTAEGKDLYAVAASDDNGERAVMISYFTNDPDAEEKSISLTGFGGTADVYLVDENHYSENVKRLDTDKEKLVMSPNSVVMIRK